MRANGVAHGHRLSPEIIGRISLSRFLAKSPRDVERVVNSIESSGHYDALTSPTGRVVRPSVLIIGAWARGAAKEVPPRVVGLITCRRGRPVLTYRSEALVRHYRMDEAAANAVAESARAGDERAIKRMRLIRKMRLVNARNVLSPAVLAAAVRLQRAFLATRDPLRLRLLRQSELADRIRRPRLDPSRVSRIIKNSSLIVSDGQELRLRDLFPNARTILKVHLRELLWEERKLLADGSLRTPFPDRLLARTIRGRTDLACLPRTLAYCRRDLGIPHWRRRAKQGCYLLATRRFSSLYRLICHDIRSEAPDLPGVYELRTVHHTSYPLGACPVMYIGSAKSLRKRLLAQSSKFAYKYGNGFRTGKGSVLFRFIVVRKLWRAEERRTYDRFVGTFGAPPKCNAVAP